ncbi:hypothetical protein [Pedobacter aquatilis]|uniref:hypothetical protein n=1 Tax=Pedobacter aquatilis TaxID=351343 RepID=UPI002930659D|nr:hypothetical protein [Pedobacter aquatilis]
MKKTIYIFICSILILTACQNDNSEKASALEFKNVNQILTKSFSNLNTLDTFKIELTGKKAADIILHFTIKNNEGKEIFSEDLKGKDLVDNTDPNIDLSKEKAQVLYLKTIANDFFAEDNFLEPAVMPDDKVDNNAPDKALYEELKKSGLNGFKYRLGKESNLYIAWSEKEQKVKVYYKCC